jgi:hypothetical protein
VLMQTSIRATCDTDAALPRFAGPGPGRRGPSTHDSTRWRTWTVRR